MDESCLDCDSSNKRKFNILFNNIARYVNNLRRYDHISVAARNLYGVTFDNLLNIHVLLFLHWIAKKKGYWLIYLTGYVLISHHVVGILWFLGIATYFPNDYFIYMLFDSVTFFHYISNATPMLIISAHIYFKIFVNFIWYFLSLFFIYICKFVSLFPFSIVFFFYSHYCFHLHIHYLSQLFI